MSIAFVNAQAVKDDIGGFSIQTPGINHAAGNLLYAFMRAGSVLPDSIADDAGNTWHSLGTGGSGTGHVWQAWYAWNCLGNPSNKVTLTFVVSASFIALTVKQFSGVQTSSDPLDQNVASDQPSAVTTYTSPSFTTTQADELLVAGATPDATGETYTPGSGYTIDPTATADYITAQYQIVSAIQTSVTASIGVSSAASGSIQVATFKGSGVAAALTGTAIGGIAESDVVAGGKTIIITLTGDTFVPN